ncbi:MAG TPA: aminopeptidase [Candidatus Dormibacteraeota bacterium]|nr:aminopeptidase [Candidatus Dormibacteraeota bacterium]
MDEAQRLQRLADLAVRVGANVQPGQLVVVSGFVENAPLMREIARASYRAGAHRVEAGYRDMHFTRALIELGPDEALSESMPWDLELLHTLIAKQAAVIQVSGDAEPTLLSDLDGTRVARAQPNDFIAEYMQAIGKGAFSWTIVPAPNPGWAREIFGKPDMDALWQAVETAVRLDDPDPIAAWRRHIARLKGIAGELTARRFDSLHYRGPGTDFTVGLLPSSMWKSAGELTSFGVDFVPNLPTEEVFTSPDPRRAEGTLRSTRPLQLGGTMIRNLEVEFHDGHIVNVDASSGADVVRGQVAIDENASRLGEVSLVDGQSAVGRLGITFFNTLFDENATCHVAYGSGFPFCVEDEADRAVLNESAVHTDFMVGGPEVEIDGQERGGAWVPILRNNEFQIK